jgi:hypothetical protein
MSGPREDGSQKAMKIRLVKHVVGPGPESCRTLSVVARPELIAPLRRISRVAGGGDKEGQGGIGEGSGRGRGFVWSRTRRRGELFRADLKG